MSVSPQPIRFCLPAMKLPPKKLAYRLIGLAEVLLSQGRVDEAYEIARVALKGFVSFAEDNTAPFDGLHIFLSAIEYFTSGACVESGSARNALIRLYGRLLHLKHAYMHDWDHVEHPILRSCVLHGVSGGAASALADLTRKSKLWRMNPDNSYVVTTGFVRPPTPETAMDNEEGCMQDELGEDESDSNESPEDVKDVQHIPRKKQVRYRGVTERMIEQRKSPTIAEWMTRLPSIHS